MPSLFSRSTRSHHPQTPSGPSSRLNTDASGQFLETSAAGSQAASSSSSGNTSAGGHLSPYPNLTLSLTHLETLISVVSETLDVSTPFVFSADAMDLDAGRVKRLIDKFVGIVCSGKGAGREAFLDEARFSGPHELAMLLRWGLARVVRVETVPAPSSSTPPGTPTTMQTLSPGALIPYLAYLNWAAEEHRLGYPPAHFARLLDTMVRVPKQSIGEQGQIELELTPIAIIPPQLKQSLLALFSLLSRLVAHSAKSGCTPPTLAPLFGVLMFGLDAPTVAPNPSASFGTAPGAPSHPFTTTYTSYLRSTHAMEHLILSFIRWQDTPLSLGGGGIGASGVGGVPTRCKEWVREYPRGLSNHQAVLALVGQGGGGGGFAQGGRGALGPRKGAKTLRLVSVKRTVPVYDPDLVASCGRWDRIGVGSYSASSSFNSSSSLYTLAGSKEWERISPHSGSKEKGREKEKLPPKYSDSYRKRMNIPVGVEPGTLPGSPLSLSRSTSSNSSYGNTSSFYGRGSTISTFTYGIGGLSGGSTPTSPSTPNGKDSSERFKTLTDAQWGLFESSGFLSSSSSSLSTSSTTIDSALKFDLTESARKARLNLNRSSSNDGDQGRNPGVSWGDFVSAGFDARERDRDGGMPLVVSTGTGAGGMNYGVAGVASPGRRGLGSAGSSGGGTGYLDTKGKPTDVGEFTLDTGLDAALQFNLAEFGVWSLRDKDKDREKERERERTGSFGLAKRLKKKEKPLPPFTHDTTPLLGSEALVEAAFVDVWVDLVCWGFAGGGMGMEGSDSDYANSNSTALTLSRSISATGDDEEREREREKERERWRNDLFRECNWALVEFKALPSSNSTSPNANLNTNSSSLRINTNIGGSSSGNASTSSDPRTSSSLLLFEEYVPREYRAQLAHQILGIHPSVILNPSANAMIATSPSGRVRLGSLFASSSNVNVSTASLSLKKEKDKKKDKKDKMGGGLFSGSTRTLTSSTPTPYNDPRNGTATSTPTPYDSRSGATPTPYDSRSRSQFGGATPTPTPYDSHNGSTTPKQVEFDAMLAENRGTKVIRLARDGSQRDRDPERMDYEVDYGASPISRTISLTEEDEREDEEYTGGSSSVHSHLPEGAMPPRAPGASLPPVPTMPTAATATSPTDTPNTNSTAPPSAAPAAPSTPTTASTLFSRLPTSSKPKGPKDRSDRDRSTRRQSRQNLVPAEYHTVEFETRLMEGSGDDSADNDADAGAGGSGGENSPNPGLGGDAFLEEAAKRRRAARLAERERLRSERRGNKRFSLGRLGGGGGGGEDDDDEAWVDIVVPGYGGTPIKGSAGKGKGKAAGGDPEEASAEVARVLSAVRGGQPYPLDGDEDEDQDQLQNNRHTAVVNGGVRGSEYSDDIEVQMIPRKDAAANGHGNGNGYHQDDESYDGEEGDEHESAPKQRLGYFDLHPDRRPVSQDLLQVRQPGAMSSRETDMLADNLGIDDDGSDEEEDGREQDDVDEDDPRARYAYGSDDEHDVDAEIAPRDLDKVYNAAQTKEKERALRPLPTVPFPSSSKPSASTPPAPAPSSSSTPAPPAKDTPAVKQPSVLNTAFGSTSGTPGKTAALIEMYREREKKSTTATSPVLNSPSPLPSKIPTLASPSPVPAAPSPVSAPAPAPAPSKIPTKAALPIIPGSGSGPGSASSTPPSLPTSPAAPVPAAKPLLKPTPTPIGINSQLDDLDEEGDGLVPPPGKSALADDGRSASPGRYIHGAPLHNVMEEEEED